MSVDESEVRITLLPSQNVVAEAAVIVGVAGIGLTVTVSVAETPELQPLEITSTENIPLAETVIDCDVSPFDQKLSFADEEVRTTESPSQNVVGPLAVIVGIAGTGLTVTGIVFDTPDEQPFEITSTE